MLVHKCISNKSSDLTEVKKRKTIEASVVEKIFPARRLRLQRDVTRRTVSFYQGVLRLRFLA